MFLLEQFLPAVAVAAAVAAAVSALTFCGKRACPSAVLAACALGAGYFAGHVFVTGWTPFPPTDTTNWLAYFALAAAAIGSLTFLLGPNTIRIAVLGLLCVGAMRLLLSPKFRYGWSAEEGWLWAGCLGGAALLLTLGLATTARRSSNTLEPPLLLIIVSAGTAVALILSGSLLLGQFAAVLSATVMGSLVLTSRGGIVGDGAASAFSLLLVAVLACGYFFAELPALSAVLLAVAPIGALIPMGASAPRWAGAATRVTVVGAVVGGAILAAFRSSPSWR